MDDDNRIYLGALAAIATGVLAYMVYTLVLYGGFPAFVDHAEASLAFRFQRFLAGDPPQNPC